MSVQENLQDLTVKIQKKWGENRDKIGELINIFKIRPAPTLQPQIRISEPFNPTTVQS